MRSLRVMCVLYISRMTSSHMPTRNGWSHQTEGPTDMSHLTNEDTDVAHLANEVTGVAHLILISTDDAHLVMVKADMTNVDTIARPRTTATAVTGNDVGDMRSAGRKGMCPLTPVGHHHLPDVTRDTLIQCRPPVPDLVPEIGGHTDARTVVSRAGPQNTHRNIKKQHIPFYLSSSSDSEFDDDKYYRHRHSKHGDPRMMPKNLKYYGSSSWLSF